MTQNERKYTLPLNSTGLNCVGPLTCSFFLIVNTVQYYMIHSWMYSLMQKHRYGEPTLNYTWIFDCVFANHVSDKRLVSGISRECLQINNKKINKTIF